MVTKSHSITLKVDYETYAILPMTANSEIF
jgi:hypothetical protein